MDIADLTKEKLSEYLTMIGEKPFHAKQVFKWLGQGAESFDDMTDLSKPLRARLAQHFTLNLPKILKKQTSRDGTVKYLFGLADGNTVETVLMDYKHGVSACISSQVGCRMGCSFCASTLGGLVRSLAPSEMTGQMIAAGKDALVRISSVVIMGIGEPLDNYDNLMVYLHNVNDKDFLNLGLRHVTVSTCGLADGIRRLADEELQINLALSLHAANDEKRRAIMPVANKFPLDEVLSACDYYFEKTSRRITFEYALIAGKNDSDADARELAKLLFQKNCHVNLIAVNEVRERENVRPSRERIERFIKILEEHHVTATLRRELGSDIDAACGQLRRNEMR